MTFRQWLDHAGIDPYGGACVTVATDGLKGNSNIINVGVGRIVDELRWLYVSGANAGATFRYTGIDQTGYERKCRDGGCTEEELPDRVREMLGDAVFMVVYNKDFFSKFHKRLDPDTTLPVLDLSRLIGLRDAQVEMPDGTRDIRELCRRVDGGDVPGPASFGHLCGRFVNSQRVADGPTAETNTVKLLTIYMEVLMRM